MVDYGYTAACFGEAKLQELFSEAVLQNLVLLRRVEADHLYPAVGAYYQAGGEFFGEGGRGILVAGSYLNQALLD